MRIDKWKPVAANYYGSTSIAASCFFFEIIMLMFDTVAIDDMITVSFLTPAL